MSEACYSAYGLKVATELRFEAPLRPASPPADFELRLGAERPIAERFENAEPVYASPVPAPDGRTRFELRRLGRREVMRFTGRIDFVVGEGAVDAYPLSSRGREELEVLFLSSVLAYCLERSGVLALHASAVVVDGRAVALMADSGGGKSSLATSLVAGGGALLTDDILAVDTVGVPTARPGYPLLKIRSDAGRALLGERYEALPRVAGERYRRALVPARDGIGSFYDRPAPLAAVYLPERAPELEAPRIEPLPRREALIEAVRHTFTPRLVEGAGLAGERFERLGVVASEVGFRRLRLPWGATRLPEAAAAVRLDVSRH